MTPKSFVSPLKVNQYIGAKIFEREIKECKYERTDPYCPYNMLLSILIIILSVQRKKRTHPLKLKPKIFVVVCGSYWMKDMEKKWQILLQYGLGVFLKFQYLRVSINTILCNPRWDIVKVFFPILMDVDNLSNHVKFVYVFFCFSFSLISLLGIIARRSTIFCPSSLQSAAKLSLLKFVILSLGHFPEFFLGVGDHFKG